MSAPGSVAAIFLLKKAENGCPRQCCSQFFCQKIWEWLSQVILLLFSYQNLGMAVPGSAAPILVFLLNKKGTTSEPSIQAFPSSHKSLPVPLRDLTPFWWDSVSLTLFLLSEFQDHPFTATSSVPALSGHIIPTPEGSICFLFLSLPISSLPSPVFPVFPPHTQYFFFSSCNSYYCLENEEKNQHLSRWIQPLHTPTIKG